MKNKEKTMSDNCFLCLNISRTRRCSQCLLKARRKCWEQYIRHWRHSNSYHPYSRGGGIICPQCKKNSKNRRYNTRLHATETNKTRCINTIKNFLNDVDTANGKENKKRIAKELFEYLYQNMWFVRNHRKFERTVRDKLVEFSVHENWAFATEMYMKMFGETII